MKVAVTGAAGLVGQNLIARLKARPGYEIVGIDKHPANTAVLRDLHPEISVIEADLAERGNWAAALDGCDVVVVGHAQIGGLVEAEFNRNNLVATERLLEAIAARGGCKIVHISSSVVNSAAVDWYTETKKAQEAMVLAAANPTVVLRPTLMFGWFDRKHLGWLARFMRRAPLFPVPGDGRYLRQPLYAGDFCDIIIACLERDMSGTAYNISGQERITYIDLMRLVREAAGARAPIVKVPYAAFWLMLAALRRVDEESAVHHQAAEGAGHAGRVRGDRLAGDFRGHGDAVARRDDGDAARPAVFLGRPGFLSSMTDHLGVAGRPRAKLFLNAQFATFLLTGGIAACVNIASRWVFERAVSYEAAVALAYLAGMVTAFLLARLFVFEHEDSAWAASSRASLSSMRSRSSRSGWCRSAWPTSCSRRLVSAGTPTLSRTSSA